MTKEQIIKAWATIRKENITIPNDVLDFMKDSAIDMLQPIFKVGMKCEIIDNILDHEFKIGDIVTITDNAHTDNYKCENEYDYWFVSAKSLKPI